MNSTGVGLFWLATFYPAGRNEKYELFPYLGHSVNAMKHTSSFSLSSAFSLVTEVAILAVSRYIIPWDEFTNYMFTSTPTWIMAPIWTQVIAILDCQKSRKTVQNECVIDAVRQVLIDNAYVCYYMFVKNQVITIRPSTCLHSISKSEVNFFWLQLKCHDFLWRTDVSINNLVNISCFFLFDIYTKLSCVVLI